MWDQPLLPPDFRGEAFYLANNWIGLIPDELSQRPINYLEIGTLVGGNVISVCQTFAKHPNSKVYCIDPWEEYQHYSEYEGKQASNFEMFLHNIQLIDKPVGVLRGYSHDIVPKLADNSFDLIYIDGNHEPEYVLEDAVMSLWKVKVGGYMIFDDYKCGGETGLGIDAFLKACYRRIEVIGLCKNNWQLCVKRIK